MLSLAPSHQASDTHQRRVIRTYDYHHIRACCGTMSGGTKYSLTWRPRHQEDDAQQQPKSLAAMYASANAKSHILKVDASADGTML